MVANQSSAPTASFLGRQFAHCRRVDAVAALGQKRTWAPQNGMSALPPKADIALVVSVELNCLCGALTNSAATSP
jgi:hypothetical protein